MSLFKSKKTVVTNKTDYPSGTVIRTPLGVFYIKNNYRLRVPSSTVLKTWSFPHIIEATENAVGHYKILGKLGFREGTIIQNIADGKMYLISNNKRCHITDPAFFTEKGFDRNRVVVASNADTELHKDGEVI